MKKFLALLLALVMVLALAACGSSNKVVVEDDEDIFAKGEGVMSYADFTAAAVDDPVVVEAFVQAKQAYAADYSNTSVYLADKDGAYFAYRLACTQEEYDKLVPGQKIKVTGYKAEWAGEVEIAEGCTFELESGNYVAPAVDVTSLLGSDALMDHMNQLVTFKGMTVEESDGGAAFLYNWDGSGVDGDDLYFKVSLNGETYSFTVESDLCPAGSEVYEAVKALNVGDKIDLEGFLYWYEGANPHITAVSAAA